ncbi:MAG TPA: S8 family serine peptidase [Thermoanaerobaculia bacterium]
MRRIFFRFAVVWLLCIPPLAAEVVSTRCGETEVPLDAFTSAAKLTGCGDDFPDDLLWHLDRIDQVDAALDGSFDRTNRGAGSVVYVMDTGVLAGHDEFADEKGSRVIAGFDEASVRIGASRCDSGNKALAPCYDDFGELVAASHGTGVASVVAGRHVGVAPEAFVVSIRVMNERGLATTRTYLDGLDAIVRHAHSAGAPPFRTAVVNISGWVLERLSAQSSDGLPVVPYASVAKKIREMIGGVDAQGRPDVNGRRFLFVVAGNNIDGGCGEAGFVDRFPATLGRETMGLITVGGMTADNQPWAGTCRGGVEVLAPAQGIFSATITASDHYRGRRPNLRNGTSFAAPVIAGIAARLLADRPDLTPQQLESWIVATPSRTLDPSAYFAQGKVAYVRSVAPAQSVASQTERGSALH